MKRGKQTCKILKDIRRQIAEANDIEFITSECQYQGDCLGTCPKCEAEVRYLEQQLERKRMAGKAITILGISAGLVAMAPMTSCSSSPNKGTNQETISDSTNASVMFGEICPTPVEDTIPMVEKDTVNKQELPELPQEMGLIEITPISGDIITVKDSLSEKDSLTDVLEVAAVMPEFPGGMKELLKFLQDNLKYPENAMKNNVQGRVIVQFVVEKDGTLTEFKVARSVDPDLDAEALRVLQTMPKWKPGMQRGKIVRVKFTVPVSFKLQ